MTDSKQNHKHPHMAFGVEPSERRYKLRLARYAALAETIAEHVRATASTRSAQVRLLDAGAGKGRTYQYLEPHGVIEDIEFHAIEYCPRRIVGMYAADRWHQIVQADLTRGVAHEDKYFDIVVCEQVLEHLQDPQSVLAELIRVLKPGGLLIIGVPTYAPTIAQIRAHIVPRIDRLLGKERGHAQVFTAASLRRMVATHTSVRVLEIRGFRIVSGGILAFLEQHKWWYRLNRRVGKALPGSCVECQAIAVKLHC